MGEETVLRTVFDDTPQMSTYLLAFIVSEFDSINETVDDVLVTQPAVQRRRITLSAQLKSISVSKDIYRLY